MSREIIEPAIRNLIDLNGWLLRWEPKKLARMLDIPVKKLYNAKEAEWFTENESWVVYSYYYYTIDKKSRSVNHNDEIIAHPNLIPNFHVINTLLYRDNMKKLKEFQPITLTFYV